MNLLTIKYSARLKHLFSLPSIVILLGACASSPEQRPEDDLATGLARIKMEYPTRTPNLFKERLFGRIKSFQTLSGDNLLGEPDYRPDAPAIRYLDVDPGTYKLKAECEPVIDYNEHPEIWLLNHTVNVQAGQILTLKCERYAAIRASSSAIFCACPRLAVDEVLGLGLAAMADRSGSPANKCV